jgi:hypothetical protein
VTAIPIRGAVLAAAVPSRPRSSHGGLFLVVAGALGLLLILGSMLPGPALRPSLIHNVVVVHRIDLALVGGSIIALAGILRVFAG